MRFGVHVSIRGKIADAVERAASRGCETFQIFSRNPRGWQAKPLTDEDAALFRERRKEAGLAPAAVHTLYLMNLASPDDALYAKSIKSFGTDLERATKLGVEYLVAHLGNYKESSPEAGVNRVVKAINTVLKPGGAGEPKLLFENTVGAGTQVGEKISELAELFDRTKVKERVGLCFDTCHAFAAGYNVATKKGLDGFLKQIDDAFGLEMLMLVHLNDCKGDLGSRLDRHEHIGKGKMGLEAFRMIVNHPKLRHLPAIMETPMKRDPEDDLVNLATVRKLVKTKKTSTRKGTRKRR